MLHADRVFGRAKYLSTIGVKIDKKVVRTDYVTEVCLAGRTRGVLMMSVQHRHVVVVALLLLTVGTGCRAFRAELGVGLGFGAEIKLPYILHTGFGMQKYKYFGLNYDDGMRVGRDDEYWEFSGSMVIFHHEELHDRLVTLEDVRSGPGYDELHYRYAKKQTHLCPAVAPYWLEKKHRDQSTPLELRLHLLFLSLRLGVDPSRLSGASSSKEAEKEPSEQETESPSAGSETSQSPASGVWSAAWVRAKSSYLVSLGPRTIPGANLEYLLQGAPPM